MIELYLTVRLRQGVLEHLELVQRRQLLVVRRTACHDLVLDVQAHLLLERSGIKARGGEGVTHKKQQEQQEQQQRQRGQQ